MEWRAIPFNTLTNTLYNAYLATRECPLTLSMIVCRKMLATDWTDSRNRTTAPSATGFDSSTVMSIPHPGVSG